MSKKNNLRRLLGLTICLLMVLTTFVSPVNANGLEEDFELVIQYKNSSGSIFDLFVTHLKPGEAYYIESPTIPNLAADKPVVEGIMPAENTLIVVNYTPTVSKYKLTINYVYEDGTQAAPTYTGLYNAGEVFSIPSPEIEYYTPSTSVMWNTMPPLDAETTVIYTAKEYRLEVIYLHPEGWEIAARDIQLVKYNTPYYIPSPHVPGYVPNITIVEGIKGNINEEIIVKYTAIEHPLTITYRFPNGEEISYQEFYKFNDFYRIESPEIPGYICQNPIMEGIMPNGEMQVIVTYTPKKYPITIIYKFNNGETFHTHETYAKYGEVYKINSPSVNGYVADRPVIEGVMDIGGIVEVVMYSPKEPTPQTPTVILTDLQLKSNFFTNKNVVKDNVTTNYYGVTNNTNMVEFALDYINDMDKPLNIRVDLINVENGNIVRTATNITKLGIGNSQTDSISRYGFYMWWRDSATGQKLPSGAYEIRVLVMDGTEILNSISSFVLIKNNDLINPKITTKIEDGKDAYTVEFAKDTFLEEEYNKSYPKHIRDFIDTLLMENGTQYRVQEENSVETKTVVYKYMPSFSNTVNKSTTVIATITDAFGNSVKAIKTINVINTDVEDNPEEVEEFNDKIIGGVTKIETPSANNYIINGKKINNDKFEKNPFNFLKP